MRLIFDLLKLNDGEYVHLTNQEYQNIKNQASIINNGYLSKEDYIIYSTSHNYKKMSKFVLSLYMIHLY